MTFTITRPGMTKITADSPEAAARLIALLEDRDAERDRERAQRRAWDRAAVELGGGGLMAGVQEMFGTPWTPALFHSFVESLGKPQKDLLSSLAARRTATDEELRSISGAKTNQALAGVLSGVSKRAASLGLSARDVFTLTNHRNAGTRSSDYTISEKFREIAEAMNWIETENQNKS